MEMRFGVSDKRIEPLKSFIRENMLSARFKSLYKSFGGNWEVYLSCNVQDGNKLSVFLNEFYYEDNPPNSSKNVGLLQKILT
jgi:hypothetical protein